MDSLLTIAHFHIASAQIDLPNTVVDLTFPVCTNLLSKKALSDFENDSLTVRDFRLPFVWVCQMASAMPQRAGNTKNRGNWTGSGFQNKRARIQEKFVRAAAK